MSVPDSIEMLTEQILVDSTNYQAYSERAKLYFKSGQIDPAFRDINLALDLEKKDPEIWITLADLYFIIGQADNSTASLKKALELDPENISIVRKLARTYLMIRNYDASLQYIDYALSLNIDDPDAYYLRGVYNLEVGDTSKALLDLQIAGNLDTAFFAAFMQEGSVLSYLDNPEAIEAFKEAVKAKPGDENALFLLALSYQEFNYFDEALETYNEVLAINPSNTQALFNMGYISLVEKQQADEAINLFQQAVIIDPDFYEAVYNLGRAYEEKQLYDDARAQYRQALELKTNYKLAIDGLNRLDELQN